MWLFRLKQRENMHYSNKLGQDSWEKKLFWTHMQKSSVTDLALHSQWLWTRYDFYVNPTTGDTCFCSIFL